MKKFLEKQLPIVMWSLLGSTAILSALGANATLVSLVIGFHLGAILGLRSVATQNWVALAGSAMLTIGMFELFLGVGFSPSSATVAAGMALLSLGIKIEKMTA
jgi:hypothetical protein